MEAARDEEMKIPWKEANARPPVPGKQYQERLRVARSNPQSAISSSESGSQKKSAETLPAALNVTPSERSRAFCVAPPAHVRLSLHVGLDVCVCVCVCVCVSVCVDMCASMYVECVPNPKHEPAR